MDTPTPSPRYIAFAGQRRIASGSPAEVAVAAKRLGDGQDLLVFDAVTSAPVELDLRGSEEEVLARLEPAAPANPNPAKPGPAKPGPAKQGPGRPKLGVVSREISLLPRHWDWLNAQPGGASATLRRLVDEARRGSQGKDRLRRSQEAAFRFMTVMGGDLPHYEEATRAFYARDYDRFAALIAGWPEDIRSHVEALVGAVIAAEREAEA